MAPAIAAVIVLSPLRAGTGNATRVSPARARRCPADRRVRAPRKASARPGGRKGPAGGGAGARHAPRRAGAMAPVRPRGARRRKSFLPSGQAAHATGTFQRPCKEHAEGSGVIEWNLRQTCRRLPRDAHPRKSLPPLPARCRADRGDGYGQPAQDVRADGRGAVPARRRQTCRDLGMDTTGKATGTAPRAARSGSAM